MSLTCRPGTNCVPAAPKAISIESPCKTGGISINTQAHAQHHSVSSFKRNNVREREM